MIRSKAGRELWKKRRVSFKGRGVRLFLLTLLLFLFFVGILAADLFPPSLALEVGAVAPSDIFAPRNVMYIDRAKTRELQELAEKSVMPVYKKDFSSGLQDLVRAQINNYYNLMEQIASNASLPTQEKLDRLKNNLPSTFNQETLQSVLRVDPELFTTLLSYTIDVSLQFLAPGVREEDLPQLPARVNEKVGVLGLPMEAKAVMEAVVLSVLSPNLTLDQEETEKRKQIARAGVEPVRRQISRGELVIKKGDIVNEETLAALEALGLYRERFPWKQLSGTVLISAALFSAWFLFSLHFARGFLTERRLIFVGILFILLILAARFFPAKIIYLIPLPLLSIVLSSLFGFPFAFAFTVFSALGIGLIQGNDFLLSFVLLLGGTFGAYRTRQVLRPIDFLRGGLTSGLVLAFSVGAVSLILGKGLSIFEDMSWAFLNGGLSGVFSVAILLIPFTESLFDLTSPLHLIELTNPNHPLLRRLLLEVPGTYHHSIMVASLAESAASAIGANALLCRAAAFLHDLGKMVRPEYFVENQEGDNVHERISPQLSSQVVVAHTKDGVEVARSSSIPEPVVRIIASHHGTSLASYFYKQAQKSTEGFLPDETFRYPGPKPETREESIIMLADSVEAAVRSLKEKTPERIAKMVENMIEDRLRDGQLSKSELSFHDLEKIEESFVRALTSAYHPRPEYPGGGARAERGNGHHQQSTSQDSSSQKTPD